MSFFDELKRRNVFRVGIAYAIAAWVLLQITDVVGEIMELPPWGGKLILLILVIGFPLVLIFAWAFEMTPEGIKREKDVDRSQSIAPQTGKKLDRAIIGILAVAVVYLLVDKLVLQKEMGSEPFSQAASEQTAGAEDQKRGLTPAGPSVAVLPFVNMSSDPEQEYFSDGLTETLLHMLAQLPELRVAARTSSFAFKGKDAGIAEIASTLGVAHVLEGSVQKSGDRIRVTAQLIRAEDGFHVWSQNYTRPLEDIFAIQDEIATDVAGALDTSLLGGEGKSVHSIETADLTAYDLYLKAMEQQTIFSYSSLELAENFFKQALAADPEFIDAKLGLVRNYVLMQDTGLITREAARDAAKPLLEQVKTAQADNREAYAFELVMQTWEPGFILDRENREQVFSNLRNLLPLMPTETYFRVVVANFLANFHERYDEALQVVEAGLMVDPLSPVLHSLKGRVYMAMEDYDQAKSAFLKALELDPENPNHYGRLSFLAARQDDLLGKLNWMRKAAEVDPQDHELAFELAQDMYDLKLTEEGDRWASRVYALAPNSAVARKMQLLAALSREDWEETLRIARAIIEDRIDDRRGAFGDTVFTYGALMMMQNRAREAYDFLVAQDPSIADFSVLAEGPHAGSMQGVAGMVKVDFAPREEVLAEWDASMAAMNEAGLPWGENEYNRLWDAYVRGNHDQAAKILIEEIWGKPLATYIARSSDLENAPVHELLSRPDVAAARAQREAEFEKMRAEVQEMLLSPEWTE